MKHLGFLLLVSAAVAIALPRQVNATPPWVPFPNPNLPPPGVYVSPADWHVYYQNGIYIDDIRHYGFTENWPPPSSGSMTENFGSILDVVAVIPGYGSVPAHITGVPVTVRVDYGSQAGTITTYNTEMLALNVTWNSPLGTVLIRESPTLHSLGQTKIDDLGGGGGYMISSFFDIFTELSVDGGQSWVPSVDPQNPSNPQSSPVELTPEPMSLALLAVGGLMLVRRRQ